MAIHSVGTVPGLGPRALGLLRRRVSRCWQLDRDSEATPQPASLNRRLAAVVQATAQAGAIEQPHPLNPAFQPIG